MFLAFEEPHRRLAAIVLRRIAAPYALMAGRGWTTTRRPTPPFVPITDGPHVVEIDWQARERPDALRRLPRAVRSTASPWRKLAGLDNSIGGVDFVRLGALSVKAGASGTLYWDEFESRRVSYIGP